MDLVVLLCRTNESTLLPKIYRLCVVVFRTRSNKVELQDETLNLDAQSGTKRTGASSSSPGQRIKAEAFCLIQLYRS